MISIIVTEKYFNIKQENIDQNPYGTRLEEMKTTTIFLTRVENDQAANTMYELIFLNRRKPISKTFTMSKKKKKVHINNNENEICPI